MDPVAASRLSLIKGLVRPFQDWVQYLLAWQKIGDTNAYRALEIIKLWEAFLLHQLAYAFGELQSVGIRSFRQDRDELFAAKAPKRV